MQIWLLIVAIVINVSLALVILTRSRSASATAYFGISALFTAAWALGTALLVYGDTQGSAYLGLTLFLFAPMGTTLYMVLFAKHFAEVDYPRRYFAPILYGAITVGLGIILLPAIAGGHILTLVQGAAQNIIDFRHPWFLIYGGYFSLMFMVAYAYLLIGVFRQKGRAKRQLRYVLIGIFLTSFLSLITNVLLPNFGISDYIWLGPTSTIFYIIATTYAMMRHGLFDLRLALVLTFTYVLSLLALAAIYLIAVFGISRLFVRDTLDFGTNIFSILLTLGLAFLFQPLRSFFDKLTSRIFYQDNYNVDEFFASLSRTLTSTTELRPLLMSAAEQIARTLKAKHASFMIYGSHRAVTVGTEGYTKIPLEDAHWLDDKLVDASEPVVAAHLDDDQAELRRLMASHRLAVILPLMHKDVRIGYFFIGEHHKSNYTARDIRVIGAIADELVIAIQNALSVQEVKSLNAGLEQRISSATKELRASNAQLQKLDEAKDEFISMASHQLRTPLTSIKGYISMMMEGDLGELTTQQKHIMNEAFVSSERMVRLIGDFLNVSRLQTGKFIIEKHPVDLAKIVAQEIEGLEPNAAGRGLKFVYKQPKKFPLLELDENKMRQVIMNFADNAIYYSRDNSKINIGLSVVKNQVEFTVKDTGIGVPDSEKDQLFKKFFRATNARKQRPDGTGVGLFLAQKVVQDHGGQIIFESKEGKGSTFGFRLPVPKNAVKAEATPVPESAPPPAAQ